MRARAAWAAVLGVFVVGLVAGWDEPIQKSGVCCPAGNADLHLASLPQSFGSNPQPYRGNSENHRKGGDHTFSMIFKKRAESISEKNAQRYERATKTGAVFFISLICGGIAAYLIARRKPRKGAFKEKPNSHDG